MSQTPHDTRRIRFLLTNLFLMVVFVLGLVLLAAVYPVLLAPEPVSTLAATSTLRPTFTPTASPTNTLTPTLTRTPRPTFTPTITATPTIVPSATLSPTPTSLATLTPARPVVFAGHYFLAEWNPERANYMAGLLGNYPNTLSQVARGNDNSGYYRAFQFGVFALREALLRFPDAPQVESWRWRLTYQLAQLNDPASAGQVGENYAGFIVQALNSGAVDLSRLYLWFQEREPRMALYLIETRPPGGYSASYLVEIRADDPPSGSVFLWLLQSTSGNFQAQVLVEHFDFIHQARASWIVANLDGLSANGDEVAISFSMPRNQFMLDAPHVFNLAQFPAQALPFMPQESIFSMGLEYENRWALVRDETGIDTLAFQSTVFLACPVKITLQYRWNGLYFEPWRQQFDLQRSEFQAGAANPVSGYCRLIVDIAAAHWGPKAVVSLMETLLPDWPPAQDEQGRPFPLDARDEWLYRLGLNQALSGNQEAALHYLNQVLTAPTSYNSRWIEPASSFLQAYQKPTDLYRACAASAYCDAGAALDTLVDGAPAEGDLLQYLRQQGVNIVSSAFFDFDLDGKNERWMAVRHRTAERLEFWILGEYVRSDSSKGIKAVFVTHVDSSPPSLVPLDAAYVRADSLDLMPVFFLESKTAFSMRRRAGTRLPYVVFVPLRSEYPNRYLEGLWAAEKRLFAGDPPAEVRNDLLDLAKFPGLTCQNTWTCDPYYYLLGLAHELAGDKQKAVEAYHKVWSDYSVSPYTIMARLKLSGAPVPPTFTATLPPTATQAQTPTPSLTATPTLTGTPPTATPSLTPTLSPTPGTPTPATPTETPTPTVTPTTNPYPN